MKKRINYALLILCVAVEVGQILFKRSFHPHNINYRRITLFQIIVMPLSPNAYVLYKFVFHTLTLTFFDGALIILISSSSISSVGLF